MRVIALLLMANVAAAEVIAFGNGDNSIEIEFVTVGDPGNPNAFSPNRQTGARERMSYGSSIPIGTVDYEYQISRHELSLGMFEAAIADGVDLDPNHANRCAEPGRQERRSQ